MKKCLVVLVFLVLSCELSAQIQAYSRYTVNAQVEPDINIFGTKKISETFKLTYFALVEESWSEALIGLSYAPTPYLELGCGAGIEHNPAIYRLTASLWLGSGDVSFLIIGEKGDGPDNYWYKTVLEYSASESFTLGIMAWRFHGLGPLAKLKIKALDSQLWVNPTYDLEFKVSRIITGIDIKI